MIRNSNSEVSSNQKPSEPYDSECTDFTVHKAKQSERSESGSLAFAPIPSVALALALNLAVASSVYIPAVK